IVDLSRERVRQIRNSCIDEMFDKLLFVKNFNPELLQKYGIDIDRDFIGIDDDILEAINQTDHTNFTREFYTYLIYVFLSDNFSLLGEVHDVLRHNYSKKRDRHNWHNFYIISEKLINKMDFTAFVDDIDRRISETIKETYEFNFKSYISRFVFDHDIDTIELVYPIAEKIVNDEFNIFLDLNDNFIFKRNTVKVRYEYAYEALDSIGEPSDVETINEKGIGLDPSFDGDEDSIRSAMKRENGFIPIGRTSVFGLKKWEKERLDFKGGTIKDIVYDYLEKKRIPVHILELLNEIHKYRNKTSPRNVITNLKLDPEQQFQIFNQSFIGLSKLTYQSKLTNLPRFFGKTIVRYITNNQYIKKESLISYFAHKQDIDLQNMENIIQLLIDNGHISINSKNEITK